MSGVRRTGVRVAACAAGALAALLAGCAPHLVAPPELPVVTVLARFDAARTAREARGGAVDADVALWLETRDAGRLPGAQGRLALAGPDAVRLRVASLLGTALDIGARGDTLAAFVPPRRIGMQLDSAADSLGVRAPGALAYRAWSGSWNPPAAARAAAQRSDSVRVLRWDEAGDSLAIGVGASGLPAWARLARPGGGTLRVDYRAWMSLEGAAWPATLEIADGSGRYRLTCRIQRLRAAPRDRARVMVRIPGDAERLTLAMLRRALQRLGGL